MLRQPKLSHSEFHLEHKRSILFGQVLLYDPLSSWTLSPEKRKALQQKAEEDDLTSVSAVGDCLDSTIGTENLAVEDNVNKMAKRMLLRLKQKLDGVEDGVHLSVSGQVNHLIREAMDPKNLCRLFLGGSHGCKLTCSIVTVTQILVLLPNAFIRQ